MRSAFGAQGQKCSACSRVYINNQVRNEFVRLLVEKTKKINVGNPLNRDVYMGPVSRRRRSRRSNVPLQKQSKTAAKS